MCVPIRKRKTINYYQRDTEHFYSKDIISRDDDHHLKIRISIICVIMFAQQFLSLLFLETKKIQRLETRVPDF